MSKISTHGTKVAKGVVLNETGGRSYFLLTSDGSVFEQLEFTDGYKTGWRLACSYEAFKLYAGNQTSIGAFKTYIGRLGGSVNLL